jgi:hypothetical protein
MKKKWPLFILIPILLMLIFLLCTTLWLEPKEIKNPSTGTYYSFKDIQFNTLSNDFIPMEKIYEELAGVDTSTMPIFENPDRDRMFVTIMPESEDYYRMYDALQNLFEKLYFIKNIPNRTENYSEYMSGNDLSYTHFDIKTLYKGDIKVIRQYREINESHEALEFYILTDGDCYSIYLAGTDINADGEEIIRTVNIKN